MKNAVEPTTAPKAIIGSILRANQTVSERSNETELLGLEDQPGEEPAPRFLAHGAQHLGVDDGVVQAGDTLEKREPHDDQNGAEDVHFATLAARSVPVNEDRRSACGHFFPNFSFQMASAFLTWPGMSPLHFSKAAWLQFRYSFPSTIFQASGSVIARRDSVMAQAQ